MVPSALRRGAWSFGPKARSGEPEETKTQGPNPQDTPKGEEPKRFAVRQTEEPTFQDPNSQGGPFSQFFVARSLLLAMERKDLKDRTFQFAENVRQFLKDVPATAGNREDGRQLLRSSGSIGANYLEADNSLSRKDALMRMRICLKESRESEYWLRLLDLGSGPRLTPRREALREEAVELSRIFATIARKLAG